MNLSPEILPKEPDQIADFEVDLSQCRGLVEGQTLASVETASVTPSEEHHRLAATDFADSFMDGEERTANGVVVGLCVGSADTSLDVYVRGGVVVLPPVTLTGENSGATCQVTEAPSASTKQGDGLTIESATATSQRVVCRLTNGLRPPAGRNRREYLVRLLAVVSDGTKVPGAGRVHIPEAVEASN